MKASKKTAASPKKGEAEVKSKSPEIVVTTTGGEEESEEEVSLDDDNQQESKREDAKAKDEKAGDQKDGESNDKEKEKGAVEEGDDDEKEKKKSKATSRMKLSMKKKKAGAKEGKAGEEEPKSGAGEPGATDEDEPEKTERKGTDAGGEGGESGGGEADTKDEAEKKKKAKDEAPGATFTDKMKAWTAGFKRSPTVVPGSQDLAPTPPPPVTVKNVFPAITANMTEAENCALVSTEAMFLPFALCRQVNIGEDVEAPALAEQPRSIFPKILGRLYERSPSVLDKKALGRIESVGITPLEFWRGRFERICATISVFTPPVTTTLADIRSNVGPKWYKDRNVEWCTSISLQSQLGTMTVTKESMKQAWLWKWLCIYIHFVTCGDCNKCVPNVMQFYWKALEDEQKKAKEAEEKERKEKEKEKEKAAALEKSAEEMKQGSKEGKDKDETTEDSKSDKKAGEDGAEEKEKENEKEKEGVEKKDKEGEDKEGAAKEKSEKAEEEKGGEDKTAVDEKKETKEAEATKKSDDGKGKTEGEDAKSPKGGSGTEAEEAGGDKKDGEKDGKDKEKSEKEKSDDKKGEGKDKEKTEKEKAEDKKADGEDAKDKEKAEKKWGGGKGFAGFLSNFQQDKGKAPKEKDDVVKVQAMPLSEYQVPNVKLQCKAVEGCKGSIPRCDHKTLSHIVENIWKAELLPLATQIAKPCLVSSETRLLFSTTRDGFDMELLKRCVGGSSATILTVVEAPDSATAAAQTAATPRNLVGKPFGVHILGTWPYVDKASRHVNHLGLGFFALDGPNVAREGAPVEGHCCTEDLNEVREREAEPSQSDGGLSTCDDLSATVDSTEGSASAEGEGAKGDEKAAAEDKTDDGEKGSGTEGGGEGADGKADSEKGSATKRKQSDASDENGGNTKDDSKEKSDENNKDEKEKEEPSKDSKDDKKSENAETQEAEAREERVGRTREGEGEREREGEGGEQETNIREIVSLALPSLHG